MAKRAGRADAADRTPAPTPIVLQFVGAKSARGLQVHKRLYLSIAIDPTADLLGLTDRLTKTVEPHVLVPVAVAASRSESPLAGLVEAVAAAVAGLQEAAGIPVAAGARVLAHKRVAGAELSELVEVAIWSMVPTAALRALAWTIDLANQLHSTPEREGLSVEQRKSLDALMSELRGDAPAGNNTRHLVRAALALGIPHMSLPRGVFQLGWGKRARLFQSTNSDATSVIGAGMARDKLATAALLRSAEVPMPEHEEAPSVEAALDVARRLGFPVVVKPTDSKKGAGATANLQTEGEVRDAYAKARAVSENVLVEKHIPGQEYRLLVVHGRLFWAYERVPASLAGDGASSVRQLVENLNRTRRVGPNTGLSLSVIEIDQAAAEILEEQGLTPDAVPASGQVVRLQRVPGVAGGGEVVSVFDRIHPDNAAMAERAARLMRLDVAGIDFLTPDIARPWHEVGGKITEVNERPQISPLSRADIYEALLAEMMRGDGRIPIAVVIGQGTDAMQAETQRLLAKAGICAGMTSGRNIVIGRHEIARGAFTMVPAARAVAMDPTVEAIVVFTDGKELSRHGSPFDRVDLLVMAEGAADLPQTRKALSAAQGHLKGELLLARGDPLAETLDKRLLRIVKSPSDLAAGLCKLLAAKVVRERADAC